MFNEAKTAQMAAYLLAKSGGRMRYIKLIKLLYLADRESMRKTGDSMTHDRFYSLKNGPILSCTLDLLRGQKHSEGWSSIVRKDGYQAELVAAMSPDDLDELSPFNLHIMDDVYARFGGMGWRQLCEWTHKNCPEWMHPGRSNLPISAADVFHALGWTKDEARDMDEKYNERRELDRTLASFN